MNPAAILMAAWLVLLVVFAALHVVAWLRDLVRRRRRRLKRYDPNQVAITFNGRRLEPVAETVRPRRVLGGPIRFTLIQHASRVREAALWTFAHPDEHAGHGRGTAEDGPDGSDCACRGTEAQLACANTGCGFCVAARAR